MMAIKNSIVIFIIYLLLNTYLFSETNYQDIRYYTNFKSDDVNEFQIAAELRELFCELLIGEMYNRYYIKIDNKNIKNIPSSEVLEQINGITENIAICYDGMVSTNNSLKIWEFRYEKDEGNVSIKNDEYPFNIIFSDSSSENRRIIKQAITYFLNRLMSYDETETALIPTPPHKESCKLKIVSQPLIVVCLAREREGLAFSIKLNEKQYKECYGYEPDLRFLWRKIEVGEEVNPDSEIIDERELRIPNPLANHSGKYKCIVEEINSNKRVVSKIIKVSVVESKIPKITQDLENIHVIENKNALLSIKAVGWEPLFYNWILIDKSNDKPKEKILDIDGQMGEVKMTKNNHGNELYCLISNSYGTVKSETVKIIVDRDPLYNHITTYTSLGLFGASLSLGILFNYLQFEATLRPEINTYRNLTTLCYNISSLSLSSSISSYLSYLVSKSKGPKGKDWFKTYLLCSSISNLVLFAGSWITSAILYDDYTSHSDSVSSKVNDQSWDYINQLYYIKLTTGISGILYLSGYFLYDLWK